MIPSLIGNSISYGLYFFWYEFFKVLFKEEPQNLMKLCKIALFSGVITTTLVNPFWVLHSKMTVKKNPLDLKATIQKIVHNEGFGSLFKGLTASLILVLNPIIQFIIYEILKRKLSAYFLLINL